MKQCKESSTILLQKVSFLAKTDNNCDGCPFESEILF